MVAPTESAARVFCVACEFSMKAGSGAPLSRLPCPAAAQTRALAWETLVASEQSLDSELAEAEAERPRGERVGISLLQLGNARSAKKTRGLMEPASHVPGQDVALGPASAQPDNARSAKKSRNSMKSADSGKRFGSPIPEGTAAGHRDAAGRPAHDQ